MNILRATSFIGLMVLSASSLAQVNISVPGDVEILVANAIKPHLTGGVFDNEKTLSLADGQQQIVFRYKPYFAQGKDNIGVESDAIVASFTAADKDLSFKLPKYRHAKDAQKYIKNLQWSLVDKQNNQVKLKEDKLLKEGMQIGRNYLTEIAVYNQSQAPAAVAAYAPQNPQVQSYQPVRTTQPGKPAPKGATTPETMLHYWYEQADEAAKARFKKFINQQ
ncbi:hypothetical protein VA7868_03227 [Vibrio aerogenes CECT 7868]|uniref:UPF0319 protein VA7868_03227 n=1 Tax=Vibrio aerogenes CECT 7868 TaxID=1216006 RepID=A0A1M5ZU10_9VIBR|nr:DUF2057 family protein [Vibrio aerogenes]SHI27724.1 hypothetical protein VA7868_03227 [Vibrio aerogenes CECT 7868]